MPDFNSQILFYLSLVQNRIKRTLCRSRIILALNRLHNALQSRKRHYRNRKIIPRTNAFVGKMINFLHAGLQFRQCGNNGFGQIAGIGRTADLVKTTFRLSRSAPSLRMVLTKLLPKVEYSQAVLMTKHPDAFPEQPARRPVWSRRTPTADWLRRFPYTDDGRCRQKRNPSTPATAAPPSRPNAASRLH